MPSQSSMFLCLLVLVLSQAGHAARRLCMERIPTSQANPSSNSWHNLRLRGTLTGDEDDSHHDKQRISDVLLFVPTARSQRLHLEIARHAHEILGTDSNDVERDRPQRRWIEMDVLEGNGTQLSQAAITFSDNLPVSVVLMTRGQPDGGVSAREFSHSFQVDNASCLIESTHQHDHHLRQRRATPSAATCQVLPGVYLPSSMSPNVTDSNDNPRTRRTLQQSSRHRVCHVYLDADASFLAMWGGKDGLDVLAARIRMLDVFFHVAALYQANRPAVDIELAIAGISIHKDLALLPSIPPTATNVDPQRGPQLLTEYQRWLAQRLKDGTHGRSAEAAPDRVCLNHLFTHSMLGGVLGVAIQASPEPNVVGGMCATTPIQGRMLNTGFTSTRRSDGHAAPTWQTSLSTAHELAHNIGAAHDCEFQSRQVSFSAQGEQAVLTEKTVPAAASLQSQVAVCGADDAELSCVPTTKQGGPYLMYPAVAKEIGLNSATFSPCSVADISSVLALKGHCLQEPALPCDPDQASHTCCSQHGAVLPMGTPCAAKDNHYHPDCIEAGASVCSGKSPMCPAALAPPGSPCASTDGHNSDAYVCDNKGRCVHPNGAFCSSLRLEPCTHHRMPCVRACLVGDDGPCLPWSVACETPLSAMDMEDHRLFMEARPQRYLSGDAICQTMPVNASCMTNSGTLGQCQGTACAVHSNSDTAHVGNSSQLNNNSTEQNTPAASDSSDNCLIFTSPCSAACGDGNQTVLTTCNITSPVAQTSSWEQVLPCRLGPCVSSTDQGLVVVHITSVDSQASLLSDRQLGALLTQASKTDIQVSSSSRTGVDNMSLRAKVASCLPASQGQQCLDAMALLNWLGNAEVMQSFQDLTGLDYTLDTVTSQAQTDLIIAAATVGAGAIVLVLIVLLIRFEAGQRKKQRRLEKQHGVRFVRMSSTADLDLTATSLDQISASFPSLDQSTASASAPSEMKHKARDTGDIVLLAMKDYWAVATMNGKRMPHKQELVFRRGDFITVVDPSGGNHPPGYLNCYHMDTSGKVNQGLVSLQLWHLHDAMDTGEPLFVQVAGPGIDDSSL